MREIEAVGRKGDKKGMWDMLKARGKSKESMGGNRERIMDGDSGWRGMN